MGIESESDWKQTFFLNPFENEVTFTINVYQIHNDSIHFEYIWRAKLYKNPYWWKWTME